MEEEENTSMENELTREELKVMALKEALSTRVSEYEDRIADLRVEITQQQREIERLNNEVASLRNLNDSEPITPEILHGTVQ